MGDLLRNDQLQRLRAGLPWLGLLLVAVVALAPLLLERPPVEPVAPYASALLAWGSKGAVLLTMFGAIGVAARAARADDPWALRLVPPLILMAGLMTAWHWYSIDRHDFQAGWQRTMYFDILNHRREAPHQFRALPYGFARSLELVT